MDKLLSVLFLSLSLLLPGIGRRLAFVVVLVALWLPMSALQPSPLLHSSCFVDRQNRENCCKQLCPPPARFIPPSKSETHEFDARASIETANLVPLAPTIASPWFGSSQGKAASVFCGTRQCGPRMRSERTQGRHKEGGKDFLAISLGRVDW